MEKSLVISVIPRKYFLGLLREDKEGSLLLAHCGPRNTPTQTLPAISSHWSPESALASTPPAFNRMNEQDQALPGQGSSHANVFLEAHSLI